jgi:hypothetical protein
VDADVLPISRRRDVRRVRPQGIGGPGRDERWAMIDLRATAVAGAITILFVAVAVLRWRG